MKTKSQVRIYKVTNHATGEVRLVQGYNSWQSVAYVTRDDYTTETVNASELLALTATGLKVEKAVKDVPATTI